MDGQVRSRDGEIAHTRGGQPVPKFATAVLSDHVFVCPQRDPSMYGSTQSNILMFFFLSQYAHDIHDGKYKITNDFA